jgi:hypothetical protein
MGEILIDGGFNIWASLFNLEYWSESISGSSTINREQNTKIEGNYSLRLDIDASNNGLYVYQAITLVNTRTYKLTIWYKTAAGKTAKFWLNNSGSNVFLKSDGSWQETANEITLPASTSWTRYDLYFFAHGSYQSYVLYLGRETAASSSIYYDRCSIASAFNNCGFCFENEWDIGTLTALTEETNFPASNTRHRWHKKTWRSTAVDVAQWLKVDRGRSLPGMRAFINRNNNFSSGATIKIQGNASDVWTSPAYNQTLGYNTHTIAHILRDNQELQWWKHEITDTGNPDGYLEAGRIFLGPIWEPERNFAPGGGQKSRNDGSILSSSEGGQISSIELDKFSPYEYIFESVMIEDKANFDALFEAMGHAKGWFFIPDLRDPGDAIYVRFAAPLSFTPESGNLFTVQISLEELR